MGLFNPNAVGSLATSSSTPATPEQKIRNSWDGDESGYNKALATLAKNGVPNATNNKSSAASWVVERADGIYITWRISNNQVIFYPESEYPDLPKNAARKWIKVPDGMDWKAALASLKTMIEKGDESDIPNLKAKLMEAATREPEKKTDAAKAKQDAHAAAKQRGEKWFMANSRYYWCGGKGYDYKTAKLMTPAQIASLGLAT